MTTTTQDETVNDVLGVPPYDPGTPEDQEAMRKYFAQNSLTVADTLCNVWTSHSWKAGTWFHCDTHGVTFEPEDEGFPDECPKEMR